MKKFLLLLCLPLLLVSFKLNVHNGLTEAERKFAVDHLNKTRADLIAAVKDLSDEQLNYKPAPDRWSVLECVQHITLASEAIHGLVQQTLKSPNDSGFKPTVADEAFINMIEDRSHKVQAAEPLKPVHSPYKDISSVLKSFNEERDSLIAYVNTTNDDLRGHITDLGFAKVDAYQVILLVSAHTNRHTQQLNEVKADPGFPKK
jgi:hypothetical protein